MRYTPSKAELGKSGKNKLQFQASESDQSTCAAHLPGGVFEGYTSEFDVVVHGSALVPSPPLQLVERPPKTETKTYIFCQGLNCPRTTPPEIVIES